LLWLWLWLGADIVYYFSVLLVEGGRYRKKRIYIYVKFAISLNVEAEKENKKSNFKKNV
jgi:hypothetical protein